MTWKNYLESGDVANLFSENEQNYVFRLARKNPRFSVLDLSRSINEAKDVFMSKMTISRNYF